MLEGYIYAEFNGDVNFICVRLKVPFLGNFLDKVLNIKIVSLSWNLVVWLIWICRIQFSGDAHFFSFWLEYPFWANLVQKLKIVCSLKYTEFIGDAHFIGFTLEILFWPSLVQKIKIVSLKWNLVLRLIQIWLIHHWCSYFWPEVSFFWKFVPKYQYCLLRLKFRTFSNWNT